MPCTHDFGLLSRPDPAADYEAYEPERYGCISVEDDLLETRAKALGEIAVYWHRLDRPAKGLAWYGITLIPPESAGAFWAALEGAQEQELAALARLFARARAEGAWVIHYGI